MIIFRFFCDGRCNSWWIELWFKSQLGYPTSAQSRRKCFTTQEIIIECNNRELYSSKWSVRCPHQSNKCWTRLWKGSYRQREDPIQDHFMITKLGFWSIAQIFLDFTAAIHSLRTFWFLALKGQQRIQNVLLKPPSFPSQAHTRTFSASSVDEVHGVQLSIPSLCGWGCHRAVTAKMIFLHVVYSVLYMCFLFYLSLTTFESFYQMLLLQEAMMLKSQRGYSLVHFSISHSCLLTSLFAF